MSKYYSEYGDLLYNADIDVYYIEFNDYNNDDSELTFRKLLPEGHYFVLHYDCDYWYEYWIEYHNK